MMINTVSSNQNKYFKKHSSIHIICRYCRTAKQFKIQGFPNLILLNLNLISQDSLGPSKLDGPELWVVCVTPYNKQYASLFSIEVYEFAPCKTSDVAWDLGTWLSQDICANSVLDEPLLVDWEALSNEGSLLKRFERFLGVTSAMLQWVSLFW